MNRWLRVLSLAVIALALFGASFYGYLVHEEGLPPSDTFEEWHYHLRSNKALRKWVRQAKGNAISTEWHRVAAAGGDTSDEIALLQAIGYVEGSEVAPAGSAGVVVNHESAAPGVNLYVSGHGPEAILMDLEGNPLHRWSMPFVEAFPGADAPLGSPSTRYFRRVFLYPDGDLLVIFEGLGLMRLDKDSKLLWAHANGAHHDAVPMDDGSIWLLTRIAHRNESYNPKRPILEDFITHLSPEGEQLASYSILEAFQRSRFSNFLKTAPPYGDIFHTNSLEILDGAIEDRVASFSAGRALISLNELNAIALVDLGSNEVVWLSTGLTAHQHDAKLTPRGGLLFLDNEGNDGFSRVIEMDPASQDVLFAYYGNEANGFLTDTSGSTHRLSNGNTLITESNAGRSFEVDPEGSIVWEFLSPHRAGEDESLVATLFDLQRIEAGFPLDWLGDAQP